MFLVRCETIERAENTDRLRQFAIIAKIQGKTADDIARAFAQKMGVDMAAQEKLQNLNKVIKTLNQIKLRFPEKTYNSLLEKKFKTLDFATSKMIEVQKVGSGSGIVKSYQLIVEAYQRVAKEVENFVPPGKSPEYVISFKKNMKQYSNALVQKSLEYIDQAKKAIAAQA